MTTSSPLQYSPAEERKSRLALSIRQEVVAGGRVESQTDYTALIRFGKPINHVLHLILTLVTFGLWGIVWLAMWIVSSSSRKTVSLTVDEYGQVLREDL